MSTKITLRNIKNILAFVTLFTDEQARLYDIQTEPLTLDPYCYSKEFNNFITSLDQENFVIDFDWPAWQNEAHRFVTDIELLTVADISRLQKLFTTHLRKERFCSGHLAGMIENEHFRAIFHRLQVIYADLIRTYATGTNILCGGSQESRVKGQNQGFLDF